MKFQVWRTTVHDNIIKTIQILWSLFASKLSKIFWYYVFETPYLKSQSSC